MLNALGAKFLQKVIKLFFTPRGGLNRIVQQNILKLLIFAVFSLKVIIKCELLSETYT